MDPQGFRRAIIFSYFPALRKTSKDTDYRCCQAVDKLKMKNIQTHLFAGIIAAILFCVGLPAVSQAAKDAFPLYPSIRTNVGFWEKVYSRYSSKQGILHDNENLNIIYEVIDLKDYDLPGSRKVNKARIKRSKDQYVRILHRLASGNKPASKEEKRVAALFGPGANPGDFRKAVGNIRCQVGQKDRFRKGLIRSGAYLPAIRDILRQKGLHTDLSYLPHVESSFNPAAYSKSGAAGIWQFTRSTGKRFMAIDYTVDERRDPIISSSAAAELLKQNYKKLGDWPLALTAYNHGVSGMMRAKRRHGSYEAIFKKHQSRLFRFASRNFYSEFLAAREVAKNYKKYFGNLKFHRPENHPQIVSPGYMAINDIVNVLKVDRNEIIRLNPSLRKPVLRGEKYIPKGFRLRLPADALVTSAQTDFAFPPDMIKTRQKRSRFYQVEKGDTVGKIARMHRVPLDDLIMANSLGRRAVIYPGQNLRLPAPGEKTKQLASAENPPEHLVSSKSTSPSPPKAEAVVAASLPPTAAAMFETKQPEPIINPTLVVGDLQIKQVTTRNGKRTGVIQVVVEETIGHYADWLQVSAGEIRRLNGIRYGKHIRVDQRVKIPMDKISKERFEEKRFEYHEELVQDFFSAFRVDQVQTYHIRKGDNIWKLCNEIFEVPLWLFQTYNVGLDLGDLKMSQPVRIPVVEKIASG